MEDNNLGSVFSQEHQASSQDNNMVKSEDNNDNMSVKKPNKKIYIVASALIGVFALLAVYFILIGVGIVRITEITLTIQTGSFSIEYDGLEHGSDEVEIISGELGSGHTIVYELPYSIKEVGTIKNQVNVTIYDAFGVDVTEDYTLIIIEGDLTIRGRELEITTDSKTKTYDGTALVCDVYHYDGVLYTGDTLEIEIYGSITDVLRDDNGSVIGVDNSFSYRIIDKDGEDSSRHYDVTKITGTLMVQPIEYSVESEGGSQVYNGDSLSNSNVYFSGTLCDGDTIEVIMDNVEITDAGEAEDTYTVIIYDENGDDVTYRYDIDAIIGSLVIEQRDITILTDSAYKDYDGTALTNGIFEIETGSLVSGHTVKTLNVNSIVNAGILENRFEFVIIDQDNKDVTSNYNITQICGYLEVYHVELTIEVDDVVEIYDGQEYSSNTEANIMVGKLVSGQTLEVLGSSTAKDVGVYELDLYDLTIIVRDSNGSDVTHNYIINTDYVGGLTIKARDFIISQNDVTKTYDGLPLENQEFDYISGSLAEGHTFNIITSTSVTDITNGPITNYLTYVILDENNFDVTHNYNFGEYINTSTLEITARSVGVTLLSSNDNPYTYSKNYDGSAISITGYEVEGSLVDSQYVMISGFSSVTNVSESYFIASEQIKIIDSQE